LRGINRFRIQFLPPQNQRFDDLAQIQLGEQPAFSPDSNEVRTPFIQKRTEVQQKCIRFTKPFRLAQSKVAMILVRKQSLINPACFLEHWTALTSILMPRTKHPTLQHIGIGDLPSFEHAIQIAQIVSDGCDSGKVALRFFGIGL